MTRRFTLALAVLFLAAAPVLAGEADNVGVVRAMIEAINARDFDALDGMVSAKVVRHSAATPGVEVENLDQFKTFLKNDISSVPDSQQIIDVIFGCGDMVAVRARYIGTQTGPMGPFPPSGKSVELPFVGILRVEDGKVAEMWVEWDNLSALTQLGHFPPPKGEESIR
jgi:predicted ester cyclase